MAASVSRDGATKEPWDSQLGNADQELQTVPARPPSIGSAYFPPPTVSTSVMSPPTVAAGPGGRTKTPPAVTLVVESGEVLCQTQDGILV